MKQLFFTAFLLINSAALAAQDSQQVGPYLISFDLDVNYQVQIAQPLEGEMSKVCSLALIEDDATRADIVIAEYFEPTDATKDVQKNLNSMSMMLFQCLNTTNVEDIVIDGTDGFLITAEPFEAAAGGPSNIYQAMYWLDSQECECGPVAVGKTSITITSTFTRDITETLLNRLHIVKGQIASTVPQSGSINLDAIYRVQKEDIF